MTKRVVLLNGEPAPHADTSAGHLLGLTCFETIAVRERTFVDLEAHLQRLGGSMKALRLVPEGGLAKVREDLDAALAAYESDEAIARVSIHAKGQAKGLLVEDEGVDLLVTLAPPRYGPLDQGVRVITSTRRAPAPESWPHHIKAPCLPRLLAYREAHDRNAFEALMLDARGHVVCGARSNLFAVLDGELVTPPTPPALPGITRARVLRVAREQGLSVAERPVHRDVLLEASELFLTFTGPGIVPIITLDGAPIGDGRPGPQTRGLAEHMHRT